MKGAILKSRITTILFVLMCIFLFIAKPLHAGLPKVDFNGDGKADLFSRNIYTGEISFWFINGTEVLQKTPFIKVPPQTGWMPLGVSDFNNDGYSDLIWYHVQEGLLNLTFLRGTEILKDANLGRKSPQDGWAPMIMDDFNADGKTDVFWYNSLLGESTFWIIDGDQVIVDKTYVFTVDYEGRYPIASKDLTGNGCADILWLNSQTGDISAWFLNGAEVLGTKNFGSMMQEIEGTLHNVGWTLIGLEDFNNDGIPDLVWYNIYTGQIYFWFMKGMQNPEHKTSFYINPQSKWFPMVLGDFNGNGNSDMLWYNSELKKVAALFFDNGEIIDIKEVNQTMLSEDGWFLIGNDDFSGNGIADLLWFNVFTNATRSWLFGESGSIVIGNYGDVPPSSVWQIQIP